MRKQTEHLLEARANVDAERWRYLELFELAPDAYLVTDLNGVILEANRSAADLLEVEERFLVRKLLIGFVVAERRRAFRHQLLELSRARTTQSLELVLHSRSGREFPVATTVAVAADRQGNPVGLRWIVRDVTRERAAEREILELNVSLERRVVERTAELERVYQAHERERTRLRRLLERLPEGVIAVDPEMHVEFANGEASRILGHDVEWGSPLPEPWESVSLRELAHKLFEPGAAVQEVRVDADQRTLALTGLPGTGGGGGGGGGLLLVVDVSERERRERAEREFISNAAHELRTPLAAIASAIDVLQSGAKEQPEARDLFLGHIERESRRLNRLAHALLVLARAQRGDQAARAETVPLRPLLEETVASLAPLPGVRVEVRCAPELAAVSNAALLAQALASIGANAAKYTKRGRIVLQARPRRDEVVAVEVRDTGPGISPEEQELVLKRFYRAPREADDGFGLGLAIAAEAVRAAGGQLELESSPRGTIARLLLPGAELIAT